MIYDSHDFTDLPRVLCQSSEDLREHLDEFDAIICTGVSGLAVAPALSVRLKKPLIVLRKPDDDCHGSRGELIGYRHDKHHRILFVDDFVDSGDTRTRCREAVEKKGSHLVAQYEYVGFKTEGYRELTGYRALT